MGHDEVEHHRPAPVDREILKKAKIPPEFRDYCAHLLLPLDRCRRENYFLPWKCSDERHAYEKCEYEE